MFEHAQHFARECLAPDVVKYAVGALLVLGLKAFLRAMTELNARLIRAGKIDADDDMSWW